MTNRVVYGTNADYEASYRNLRNSNLIGSIDQTEKFVIQFRLKDTETIFQLGTNGKLQVKWNNLDEKKGLLKIVKSLLVPSKGETLTVKPLFQQVWMKYPAPNFNLYWCNKAYHYSKHIVNPYLSQKERQILKLEVEGYELMLKMFYEVKEESGSLFGSPIILIHKD